MSSELNAIERTAADWLARSEAGLSAAEERELAAWLEGDARHAGSFEALQRTWSRLDQLPGSAAAARLEAELDYDMVPAPRPWPTPERATPATPLRARPWLSGALAASLVWLAAYFAWWRPAQADAPYAETAATEIGAARTIELPDGSTIQLNTDTAVDVLFTRTERRVRLARGEALFTIAKNRVRPFIVNAAGVDVRAVGTQFNLRLHAEALEVIVCEGQVRVDQEAGGATLLTTAAPAEAQGGASPPASLRLARASADILAAGQRVLVPVVAAPRLVAVPSAPAPLAPVEIERSLAWQNGRLVFESAPLSAIVAEFNRYNRRPLVIADAELGTRRFGGTFVATDPDTFAELLRTSYDVVVEDRAGGIALRLRR